MFLANSIKYLQFAYPYINSINNDIPWYVDRGALCKKMLFIKLYITF